MKISKSSLQSARSEIQASQAPLQEGNYLFRFLKATWFEKSKRMSFFLVTQEGKRINACVTLGMKFEGKSTTDQQIKKLVAFSEAVNSKLSTDMETWAQEMNKCTGAMVEASVSPFTSAKVREGYNLRFVRKDS
jgi:hypothetical protein